MTAEAESERLHARVRAFARERLDGASSSEDFDSLAVEIAGYQARRVPGYARLVASRGGLGSAAEEIPAVPVDAFRLTRVAAHPAELDSVRFVTSGTTGAVPGVHALRTTATYRELCLAWGERALVTGQPGPRVVVALAAPPEGQHASSLAFMMSAFMEQWDGNPLSGTGAFDAGAPSRFLLRPNGVDVAGLEYAASVALSRGQPLLVLATGFALVLLLDEVGDHTLNVPTTTVVMPTGGFKGRTREITKAELTLRVSHAFGIPEEQVVFEYGMTELSSQLYEGMLPGGKLSGDRGVYLPPPWLRVAPVDPETLRPVPPGDCGIARFTDLANVDSAVCIVTQDFVRRHGAGIELLGRRPGAPPRGCSLAVEEMVLGARS